ncbi:MULTISPECIES: tRNA cyclic N6-threonylcarbamoyladenosine(37) synthase TcdA [Thalassotalea]|uniref:tRNA cyclic N6-threonylcarbamoyladenosine(37) synthase TcdA n=1 Tax=Thalassotalea castellviae TaxID=3075612 RepID=A0ABU3A2X9_9GAMM|nr:tRNA cyclic N6-threonylcarbamoyladenosine(37) synthase TcdA [Thalassotalea sp. W431]MDT0604522.1 tRNA cyclic N6-threonylcarbamoyladenosine(37) synthase TcdA [Thalassotalea sp. W431]
MSEYQLRFGGISRLYGQTGANIIQQSHFCVIGIGGVGSWAAEALARSGVGEITLIDLDDICTTNINRQIHALTNTVGESKVEVMAARIKQINPECQLHVIEDFVTAENLRELMSIGFDYVIDAIDSVKIKTALIAHCKRNKIPLITIGGAGGQTDPSKIQLTDLSQTYQDPLLSKVRNQLRREYNFSRNTKRKFGIDAVFSSEQLMYPDESGEVCHAKQSQEGAMRLDCSGGFGAATHVTASFAFFAVSKALSKLIKKNSASSR